ncbi:MAG TPA: adenylate/guanylate cyclase domain-containing protein [Candidatus Competibacteraceae bacterium]|nr:MAG: adenylate/guanylate cyclase domain-containing protein [Candidatus Competibacteraceae bacterium]HNW78413.1 adenylate/guanylate cyclase domain-containing protein [Candidatus Competibacteraceae bacterium]HQC72751.1 adenylate/guanylate cyclase domain-containing protein [Candidatus Competibacteraceae bacterium]
MQAKPSDLAAVLGRDGARASRIVTAAVLFADICGSTRLFEAHGDQRAREIESQVLGHLADCTAAQQGVVVKTIGDEIMSGFADAASAVGAACAMHLCLKADPALAALGIAIRIGLYQGSVLLEGNDLFGDAVNVAARMVALAKADQIITTRDTLNTLPAGFRQASRDLGQAWVRGKQDEIAIAEVLWADSNSLTQMATPQEELRGLLFARLDLNYRDRHVELLPSAQVFTLGRGERNSLVVDRELVSRIHASIEFRQGKFILVDRSTNGTYLLLENGARFFVHREEFTLHGRGSICLGQAVSKHNPDLIDYTCSET